MTPYNLNTYNCNTYYPNYYPPQGYNCPYCGVWVQYHTWHNCVSWRSNYTWKQTPHKCPVCEGKQTLSPGFYEGEVSVLIGSGKRVTCRTCNGLGMIWA